MLTYDNYVDIAYQAEYSDLISLAITNKELTNLFSEEALWDRRLNRELIREPKIELIIKLINNEELKRIPKYTETILAFRRAMRIPDELVSDPASGLNLSIIYKLDQYHYFPILKSKDQLSLQRIIEYDAIRFFTRYEIQSLVKYDNILLGDIILNDSVKILHHYIEKSQPNDINDYMDMLKRSSTKCENYLLNCSVPFRMGAFSNRQEKRYLIASNLDINLLYLGTMSLLKKTYYEAEGGDYGYLDTFLDNPQITGKYLRNEILDDNYLLSDLAQYQERVTLSGRPSPLKQITKLDIWLNSYIFFLNLVTFFGNHTLNTSIFLLETFRGTLHLHNYLKKAKHADNIRKYYLYLSTGGYTLSIIITYIVHLNKNIYLYSIQLTCVVWLIYLLWTKDYKMYLILLMGLLILFPMYGIIIVCLWIQARRVGLDLDWNLIKDLSEIAGWKKHCSAFGGIILGYLLWYNYPGMMTITFYSWYLIRRML